MCHTTVLHFRQDSIIVTVVRTTNLISLRLLLLIRIVVVVVVTLIMKFCLRVFKQKTGIRDFVLLPRCKWDLHSSGMLRSFEMIVTDISGRPTNPILKGQAVQEIPKRRYLTTDQRCVTSRKSEDLKRLAVALQVSREWFQFVMFTCTAEHCVSVLSRMSVNCVNLNRWVCGSRSYSRYN
jgi:hypothetical protein